MNANPSRDETPEDPELLREVYRALKSCGWLLPETVEEVRRAEKILQEDPIEVPEELLDPLRLLASFSDEHPDSKSSHGPVMDYPAIPSGLSRLAQEENLAHSQVLSLIGLQAQMLFNRSGSKSDEISYDDWKRFYLGVKEYL